MGKTIGIPDNNNNSAGNAGYSENAGSSEKILSCFNAETNGDLVIQNMSGDVISVPNHLIDRFIELLKTNSSSEGSQSNFTLLNNGKIEYWNY